MNKKNIKVEVMSGNNYIYHTITGIILNNEGIENSNPERIKAFKELENSCQRKFECFEFTKEDAEKRVKLSGLNELIIEVTTKCNLRCKYCIFGEEYHELRDHDSRDMKFEVAQKAIDTYFNTFIESKIYNPDRIPMVSFYGGEPLLNFKLIKRCTEYINTQYGNENTFFTLTTNAALLDDEIMNFLIENKFYPLFSLDGDKKEHDRNRVSANNTGTHSLVVENMIKYYKAKKFPLFVNIVYSVDTDLESVVDFFSERKEFVCLNITSVSPINTTYYEKFTKEEYEKFYKKFNKLKDEFYNIVANGREKICDEKLKRRVYILDLLFSRKCTPFIVRALFGTETNGMLFTGTCIPGERLFVDVDGYIYPCEKVSRSKNIGNVKNGLEFDKIAEYINHYSKSIFAKCSTCKIRHMCSTCYNNFLIDGQFIHNEEICKKQIQQMKIDFVNYCNINEINDNWLNEFRMDYYKKIRELAVTLI